MINDFTYHSSQLVFKQWSRKSYAIFASLGKEVSIGHLDIEICDQALLKDHQSYSACCAIQEEKNTEKEDPDEGILELTQEQFVSLLAIQVNSDISSGRLAYFIYTIHIIHNNYSGLRNMKFYAQNLGGYNIH